MSELAALVKELAAVELGPTAHNQYSPETAGGLIRQQNLLRYLERMAELQPKVMLVGEAPGYQGARWTGLHFTSEHILLQGVPEHNLFGVEQGYQKTDEWEKVWKEPSATIVWGVMRELQNLPLIWASFPFHPFQAGNPLSNRAPSTQELRVGEHFIKKLLQLYPIEELIAIGNKAETTLGKMGLEFNKVRHPSHGGKNQFVDGIRRLLV